MEIEVFSLAADPDDPASNEDRHVVVRDRAYAVIDGASDKTGKRYDGLTGGQIAGRIVEAAIRAVCAPRGAEEISWARLVGEINKGFEKAYAHYGLAEAGRVSPPARFVAQLTLALQGREFFRFIIIGDVGLRLNGREVFRATHAMDKIGARIRMLVWRHLEARGAGAETADAVARAYTIEGLGAVMPDSQAWIDAAALENIRRRAVTDLGEVVPEIEPEIIATALDGGLIGQCRYRNRVHPLGHASLDGFPIPAELVTEFDRPIREVETVEIFSDGYFGCADGDRIDDWEARIRRIEGEDPAKIGNHASTKGSSGRRFADDRTILIVRRPSPIVTGRRAS